MTPREQRIAIAQACGWTHLRIANGIWGTRPGFDKPDWSAGQDGDCPDVPEYLDDLNAMHEAIETLNECQRALFDCKLIEVVSGGSFNMEKHPIASMHYVDALKGIHAKAPQLAMAFLKAIGKWVDQPFSARSTIGLGLGCRA